MNRVLSVLVCLSMLFGLLGLSANPRISAAKAQALPLPQEREVIPVIDPPLPSLSVRIDVTPRIASVGDTITAVIHVDNSAPIAANILSVTLPLPEGATRLSGEGYKSNSSDNLVTPEVTATSVATTTLAPPTATLDPNEGWTWQLPELAGYTGITETVTMRLDAMPTGNAVVLHAQASADGLPLPLSSTKGAVVMQPGIGSRTTHFTPGQEVTLTSYDGHTRVTIPGGAASVPLTITHSFEPVLGRVINGGDDIPQQAGFHAGFEPFFLTALDKDGNVISEFDEPVTITTDYTYEQSDALGIPEGDLTYFWYDATRFDGEGGWISVPSDVDSQSHTVTVSVKHFSNWQLSDGSSPSDAFIPSLQAGQVDLNRGSFSYNYPIDVPAGPGGVKPYLSLNYNSDETDSRKGERPLLQSSWAGKGWSFSPSYIALAKLDPNSDLSRFYTLVLNGQTYDLMRGSCRQGATCGSGNSYLRNPSLWEWHTTDESFMKIRVDVNSATPPAYRGGSKNDHDYDRYKWQVWLKDGTRYTFEEDAWQGWYAPTGYSNDYAYLETYKWYLTNVVDTHGNTISYVYDRIWGECNISGGDVEGYVQKDVWPTEIRWGGNTNTSAPDRYRVLLTSDPRTIDTAPDSADNMCGWLPGGPSQSAIPTQTRQLHFITVQTNHSSSPYIDDASHWDQVHKYGLVYRDAYSDLNRGDHNYYVLSDNAIATCGSPCTYASDTDNPKLTLLKITEWGSSTAALPDTTFDYNYNHNMARGTDFFPAGGWNRLKYVDNGQYGRIALQYENIGHTQDIDPTAGPGKSDFRGNHRVTTKTVYDAYGQTWGHSYVWTYDYKKSEAYNAYKGPRHTTPTSATVWYNRYDTASFDIPLIRREKREFRGHSDVVVHDPNGNESEHWFQTGLVTCTPQKYIGNLFSDTCFQTLYANEFRKGSELDSVSFQGAATSSNKLSEKINSFTVATTNYPYYPTGYYNSDDRNSGAWNSFHYMNENKSRSWAGSSNLEKTTSYTYENTYGNRESTTEADGTGTLRVTRASYNPCNNEIDPSNCTTTGQYMVDRKGAESIKDKYGYWLQRTVYVYKPSSNGPGIPSATGDLLLTREMIFPSTVATNTLPGTTFSKDTTYEYDSNGNRKKNITYVDGGQITVSGCPASCSFLYGAPGGSSPQPRITETVYDPLYQDLPVQLIQPQVGTHTALSESSVYDPVLRTQTSTTDYNGRTTTATYDTFGRLETLVKYLDTPSEPTVFATYADSESPPRYMIYQKDNDPANSYGYRIINQYYDGMGRNIQTKSESLDLTQNIVEDTIYDGIGNITQQGQPRYVTQTGSAFDDYLPTALQTIRWTSTQYDGINRTINTTLPDTTEITTTYTISGTYLTEMTEDAKHHLTARKSDVFGRLIKVQEYSGNGIPAGLPYNGEGYYAAITTSYDYNPLDMLEGTLDAKSNSNTMSYDSLKRKTAMSDLTMGDMTYNYNVDGNIASQTDNQSHTTVYLYDEMGRNTRKTYYDSTYSTYTYDGATSSNLQGNLAKMERYNASSILQNKIEYTYTGRGLTASAAYTISGLSGSPRTMSWTYDSADRTESITYPGGEQVSYDYDAAWREKYACSSLSGSLCYAKVDATYSPDPQGYNALGQITQYKLGNNLRQVYSYSNVMSRLSDIQVSSSYYNRSYTYDDVGNVATITNLLTTPTHVTQTYTYDHRDRLTKWQETGSSDQDYTYDELGNILTKPGSSYSYTYTHGAGDGGPYANRATSGSYTYDANGNMLTGDGRNYTWTPENMPATITKSGVTETYSYDANGERVKKTVGGVSTYYMGDLYEEEVSTPGTTQRYYYQFNGQIVAQRELAPDPPTATPTNTPTRTPTNTPTRTSTNTPTRTPTNTPTTGIGLGSTFTPTRTPTPLGGDRPDAGVPTAKATNSKANGSPNTAIASPTSTATATASANQTSIPKHNGSGKGGGITSPDVVDTLVYLHRDHLGSVMMLTNSAGSAILGSQEYDAWGKVRTGGTVTQTKLNFTGQQLDEYSELLNYNARVYDPGLGRFPSADSMVAGSANPQSWGRYNYVGGNPTSRIDPTGHTSSVPDWWLDDRLKWVDTTGGNDSFASISFPFGYSDSPLEGKTSCRPHYLDTTRGRQVNFLVSISCDDKVGFMAIWNRSARAFYYVPSYSWPVVDSVSFLPSNTNGMMGNGCSGCNEVALEYHYDGRGERSFNLPPIPWMVPIQESVEIQWEWDGLDEFGNPWTDWMFDDPIYRTMKWKLR